MLHNVSLPSYHNVNSVKFPNPKALHVSLSQEESYNTCDQNNVYSHKTAQFYANAEFRKNSVNSANYLQLLLLAERFINEV